GSSGAKVGRQGNRKACLHAAVPGAAGVGGLTSVDRRDERKNVVRDPHVVRRKLIDNAAGKSAANACLHGVNLHRVQSNAVRCAVLLEQLALAGRAESVAVRGEERSAVICTPRYAELGTYVRPAEGGVCRPAVRAGGKRRQV